MSGQEIKASLSLSLVFMFRMFGLFMVLPVMALYADQLEGATPLLVGLAIGAYGFSQALLQIPFGWLSDRVGRKKVIIAGLLLFVAGSLVAAYAESIQGVILGRVLQGCGAIAGAVTALLADLTREQYRTRSMAIFGMGIGLSFCLAMMLGPAIAASWGLSGLFLSNVWLAGAGILIVLLIVPSAATRRQDLNSFVSKKSVWQVLHNVELLRLMFGIFTLHFIVMGLFVFLPRELESTMNIPRASHGWVYLVGLLGSFLVIIPFIIYSEKQRRLKQCFVAAVTLLLVSMVFMAQAGEHRWLLISGLLVFFAGFNFLEASLPSLASKLSPAGTRGTTMGLYSTCQFAGAALGGVLSGLGYEYLGLNGVLMVCAIPTALWWLLSVTMKHPPYVSSMVMALNPANGQDAGSMSRTLAVIPGVEEVTVLGRERTAYLKVNRRTLDMSALRQYGEC
ncbi:MFS transporter [Endozoicomonas lisbonensis]|uniref:MFS family permease n=1 Tax=Endozoicomonas lisbonensis TaxID=3120522 RepID=A0ABV2SJI6_9GAMM